MRGRSSAANGNFYKGTQMMIQVSPILCRFYEAAGPIFMQRKDFFCFILLLAPPGSASLVSWCLEPSHPQGSAMMICSLPIMSRKRLVCDAADISVTHACLVQWHHRHRLPHTNHGPVSSTFKHQFVTKFIIIRVKNCGATPFFFHPYHGPAVLSVSFGVAFKGHLKHIPPQCPNTKNI